MKHLMTLLMLVGALAADAQINHLFFLNTSNQQIVQSAVEKAFITVNSSYRLQDLKSNRLYGRDGNDTFGTVPSWGIKIENGMILLDQAIHPWEYDPNFNSYRGKYGPVHCRLSFMEADSTKELEGVDVQPVNEHNLIYVLQDTIITKGKGLVIDSSEGEQVGWTVWMTEEKDSVNTFIVLKNKFTFDANEFVYEVEQPNTTKKILAGIYVVPSFNPIGVVVFKLGGVLVEKNGKWVMARVAAHFAENHTQEEGESELTPIQNDERVEVTTENEDKKKVKKAKRIKNEN